MLKDVDISSIPEDHFKALSKHAWIIVIENVRNDCLLPILRYASENLYINLYIKNQYLDKANTMELVRAMESGSVETLYLGDVHNNDDDDVILDIKTLTQYSGLGKCEHIEIYNVKSNRYKKMLKAWARRINWGIEEDGEHLGGRRQKDSIKLRRPVVKRPWQ